MKKILYITQVDMSERTGQGTYARESMSNLMKNPDIKVLFFGPKPKNDVSTRINLSEDFNFIPFKRKTYFWYILFQLILFFKLTNVLIKNKSNTILYVKYSATMVSPVLVSKIFKIPLIIRASLLLENIQRKKKPPRSILKMIAWSFKVCLRSASKIIVVTQKTKNELLKRYNVNSTKISIIPNGVNTDLFVPKPKDLVRKTVRFPKFKYLIGFVGTLEKEYDLECLIEASEIITKERGDIGFVIVGNGSEFNNLCKLVMEKELLKYYLFAGEVSHEEVPNYINRCDLMVYTDTKYMLNEYGSSALKVFEYLSCGKPIIAPRTSDMYFIEKNGLGKLYEQENLYDLARNINSIL